MLPEFVGMLGRGCERHLAPDAFLRTGGPALAERWRTESAPQRRAATQAAMRMVPPQVLAQMQDRSAASPPGAGGAVPSPAAMMPQLMQGLEAGLASKLNADTCKQASRFVESIAPLPAENVAQMVSAFL